MASTDLDCAILKAVRLALAEQQEKFDASILAAVKAAMDSVVVPQLADLQVQIKQANEAVHNVIVDIEHLDKIVHTSLDSTLSKQQCGLTNETYMAMMSKSHLSPINSPKWRIGVGETT